MPVNTPNAALKTYQEKWQRVRDVLAGQDAVHGAGIRYLPKLVDQTETDYKSYVMRTTFYNASWRTVSALKGMLFRKAPVVVNPPALDEYMKDVTLSGVPFLNFAENCSLEALSVGRLGILVDFPPPIKTDGVITVLQAEQAGLRPTMQLYTAESIIDWQFKLINNANVLSQVRLQEKHVTLKDEFTQKSEDQIRVLDLEPEGNFYRVRIYRKSLVTGNYEQVGDDLLPLMNNAPMTSIPFIFIGPDGTEAELEEPPLIDLIDLNLKHYMVTADYEHGCHFTGLPTPYVTGYQVDPQKPEKFYIGSTSAWVFPAAEAKVGFLAFGADGLASLEKNLDRKEAQMAAIGARMLAPEKAGVEAYDTVALRHSGESSILAAIAGALSRGLTMALEIFSEWAGNGEAECSVELNREFLPVPMDALSLQQYMAAWQSGAISYATLFDILQRGDVIAPDITVEEEQSRIEINPPLSLQGAQLSLEQQQQSPPAPPKDKAA